MRLPTPDDRGVDSDDADTDANKEVAGKEQPSQSRSRTVGQWRIEKKLGTGSTAYVYSATNLVDGRRAALKILRNEAVDDATRQRFKREGHVANAVGHPGVVRIFDQGVTDRGALFIVMEMLDGQSLESLRLAHGGSLPVTQVVELGCQLLDVLAAAHARRIIHRDLKPANVFLTADGQIKVLDFGLARIWDAERSSSISRTGIIMGTPAFMPPEQARGRRSLVDAQSDIWALGATLFTLITGRAVHVAPSHPAQLLAVLTKPAPALRSVAPHVAPEVAAVIDKALSFEREARWDDAGEMLDALRRANAKAVRTNALGRPRSSAPPPPPHGAVPPVEIPPSRRVPPIAAYPAAAITPIPARTPSPSPMRVAPPSSSSSRALVPTPTPGALTPIAPSPVALVPTQRTSTWAQTAMSGILAGLVAGGVALGAVVYTERHRHRPPSAAQTTQAFAAASAAPIATTTIAAAMEAPPASAAEAPAAAAPMPSSGTASESATATAAAAATATPPDPDPPVVVAVAVPTPTAAPRPKPKPVAKKPDPPTVGEPPTADSPSASAEEVKPAPTQEAKPEPKHESKPAPDPAGDPPREE